MINGASALAELVRPAGETDAAGMQRVLPVLPELGGLFPWRGLRRGSTVAVGLTFDTSADRGRPTPPGRSRTAPAERARGTVAGQEWETAAGRGRATAIGRGVGYAVGRRPPVAAAGGGSTALLLALLSAASQAGSWCAVVGVPSLGALAAEESGVALDRLALVPYPGPDWPTVVAALVDGVDVVVLAVPGQVSASIASRLVARARQRGCVLVPYGEWAGADVTLQVTQGRWEGLGDGRGRLRRRKVTVIARGRGAAARPKELSLWMPAMASTMPRIPPAPGDETRADLWPLKGRGEEAREDLWATKGHAGQERGDLRRGALRVVEGG